MYEVISIAVASYATLQFLGNHNIRQLDEMAQTSMAQESFHQLMIFFVVDLLKLPVIYKQLSFFNLKRDWMV